MVLGHGHRRLSLTSSKSPPDEPKSATGSDDETVVDSEQGNMLSHIISQLRPGADLSRVTLPTFILEPRSMLERITNFMAHPETLLPMPTIEDPVERFISVVKFYLSGWHIKPPGVKKPLNPILGEVFTCYWDYPDNTRGYYISEQTSHHPPKSSYFFMAPDHHIRIDGTLKPRSKFLGNSAASLMEGIAVMRFTNRGERFFITQPNMYARGILFGKMKYELGDHSFVRCPESGLVADLEFKTKGYFSGTYNAIGGYIKEIKTDKQLYELSGAWNGAMYIKDLATNKKQLLFDAKNSPETPPSVRPISEQGGRESQKLWEGVTNAIKKKEQDTATDEKSRIEDQQREEASKRAAEGVEWNPILFRRVQGGPGGSEQGEEDLDWVISAKVDGATVEEQTKQILAIAPILPGQHTNGRFAIDSQNHSEKPKVSTSSNPDQPPQQNQQLIDLGEKQEDEAPTPKASAQPNRHDSPQPPAGLQQPLQPSLSEKQGHRNLPPGYAPVTRADSETSEIDEFHDAES